jgi:hypothetical protein
MLAVIQLIGFHLTAYINFTCVLSTFDTLIIVCPKGRTYIESFVSLNPVMFFINRKYWVSGFRVD